jgi:hypothetical protein
MPTLSELREAHRQTGAALREAEDALGQARDRARSAIDALADCDHRSLDGRATAEELEAARTERTEAMAELANLERTLLARASRATLNTGG